MPGYWVYRPFQNHCAKAAPGNTYPIAPPIDIEWAQHLIYMTHRCKGNMINSGKINDEVHARALYTCLFHVHASNNTCTLATITC